MVTLSDLNFFSVIYHKEGEPRKKGKKMRGNGTITLPPIRGTSGRHPLPVTSGWLHFRRVGMGWRLGDFPGTWEVVRLVDRVMGSFS
jgi:hypothetical protein